MDQWPAGLCPVANRELFVVSGVGGTDMVNSLWSSEGLLLCIAAPTGLTAFNVGGITIHRLFQLPVEHASTSYWPLTKPSQKVVRATLSDVKLFIIEEKQVIY